MTIPTWVKGLLALLVIAAIVGAIYSYGQQQFGLGENTEKARWQARENKELTEANAKIQTLEEKYRAQEHWHAEQLAAVSKNYQEELKHAKAEKERVITGLRLGDIRLRIPFARTFASGGNSTAAALACATGRDGQARCELSPAAAEFLVGYASECDDVARQLSAAQAVIIKDRTAAP